MNDFTYPNNDVKAESYELLKFLLLHWENETVEFKEAKGHYDTDKIGRYFSAISNEANLKQQQYGWLILGVSEDENKHIVGTNFKNGNETLLEDFKFEIAKSITDKMSFSDIIELFPSVNGTMLRVLMFKIPSAAVGLPTAWKNTCYARAGNSTVIMQQYKIDQIRNQERIDWSKQILPNTSIANLDKDAIQLAREKYKQKMARPHISEEVESISDEEFLSKMKLVINGKLTNAAMLLLGNAEYDNFFNSAPSVMWRLYGKDAELLDYEIFTVPYISVSDRLLRKVRNLTYRYMPNLLTLFPTETAQYDTWLLRELINNCLVHSDYRTGGRIYLNEFEDKINITNPGKFLPKNIEEVLSPTYNPPFYRNQLLAEAMVKLNMIDTATSGIKRIYRIQKAKYFPMPDYDLSRDNEVSVTVYGKTIDERYTRLLFRHPELNIGMVYLLDQVQKGNGSKLSAAVINMLRRNKLIEGRKNSLYLSMETVYTPEEKVQYIKNKAFDNKYYKDLVINYLKKFHKARRKDIRKLLWEKLPAVLTDYQKESKIHAIIMSLKRKGVIITDSDNKQRANWILK